MSPVRIVVADDHPVVRDGVVAVLAAVTAFDVVGEAADGRRALALVDELDPDVLVLDLRMPELSGVEVITTLRRRGARAGVLVLTTYDTDADTVAAIEAGATGYLLKDAPTETLVDAVRATAAGSTVLSPAVATRLADHRHQPLLATRLSAREGEVLALVAHGKSNRAIAAELFVSEATVKTHLAHVYEKLGAQDRAAAVAKAYDRGILG